MERAFDCITDLVFVGDRVDSCDVILIPGSSAGELIERAAELYHSGMGKYILVSGYAGPHIPEGYTEASWLREIGISRGVPAERILAEERASNTFENAKFSLAMLQDRGLVSDRYILVCKGWHSRRALMTYQTIFPHGTEFFVSTVNQAGGPERNTWYADPANIAIVMDEVTKIGRYFACEIEGLVNREKAEAGL